MEMEGTEENQDLYMYVSLPIAEHTLACWDSREELTTQIDVTKQMTQFTS